MEEQWKVISYRTLSGDYPVQQFIDSLEIKAQSKFQDTVKLLREFGIRLGLPHVKKLTGTDLWELRIVYCHDRQNFSSYMDLRRKRTKRLRKR